PLGAVPLDGVAGPVQPFRHPVAPIPATPSKLGGARRTGPDISCPDRSVGHRSPPRPVTPHVLRYGPAGGRGCPARSGNRPARRSAWLWNALGTGSALPWYALGTRSGLALEHARHDVRPGAGIRAAGPGPAAGIP